MVEKFPEADDSWVPHPEFCDQKRKMIPWGSGGPGATCDAHRDQRVTCHLSISTPRAQGAEVRGDSSWGVAGGLGGAMERSRRTGSVSLHPGLPQNLSKASGASRPLYPFFVKITSRKVPLSNTAVGLWSLWMVMDSWGFPGVCISVWVPHDPMCHLHWQPCRKQVEHLKAHMTKGHYLLEA